MKRGHRLSTRTLRARPLAAALVAVCLAALGAGSASARSPRFVNTTATFNPDTQSHPGACSQSTLVVAHAVADLSANGVLSQYAALVAVHASGGATAGALTRALLVTRIAQTATMANHGCTTNGIIFGTGKRTLTTGETVGVAVPAALRARLCRARGRDCVRTAVTFHTVFPTNCWNLDQGTARVWLLLKRPPKPKPKPKPKPTTRASTVTARPAATVNTVCGSGNSGTSTVTLSNAQTATAPATFVVNGQSYGPVAPGQSLEVSIPLVSQGNTQISVSSAGQPLVAESVPPDPCPAAAPSATTTLSCAAGGEVVTLANAASATADATFEVNGQSYGPLAPGATQQVTVPIASGATGSVVVTSGGVGLLAQTTYLNTCAPQPAVVGAGLSCTISDGGPVGGGYLDLQLANAASATLPATFAVSATGNAPGGFTSTVGPVNAGATVSVLIPVDASGNAVTVTVTSPGLVPYQDTLSGGCPVQLF